MLFVGLLCNAKEVNDNTTIFSASDVSASTEQLVIKWYGIGVDVWGSYGPSEIYVVGESYEAALELEEAFCDRRKKLNKNWDVRC